jgi:hypothetical protein
VQVAAPLYHMNALAVSQAAFARHDTVILLPGFTAPSYIAAARTYRATILTSVPTMIAMILRETALLNAPICRRSRRYGWARRRSRKD